MDRLSRALHRSSMGAVAVLAVHALSRMKTRVSVGIRSVAVHGDTCTTLATRPSPSGGGRRIPDLTPALETAGAPIAMVLMPVAIRARITDRPATPHTLGLGGAADGDATVEATGVVDAEHSLSYVAACPAGFLDELLEEAERAACRVESVTSADYAWTEAARAATQAADSVVVVRLEDAGEIRIIAARDGRPTVWRRLPLGTDPAELAEVVESVAEHFGREHSELPIVVLGDAEFRARIGDASIASRRTASVETSRLQELAYDPAAVAAAFAGTGPRFVPPEVVQRARARTRRNALLAAALTVICFAVAGFLDVVDLRSETTAVRAARQAIEETVAEAMTARDSVAASAMLVSALEERRLTTPRWTAMLGSLADAAPADAHVRSLRAVDDSVYIEVEAQDLAAAVEGLRQVPWWRGLRTVSPVETDVGGDGLVTERVTVAGEVEWEPLNAVDGPSP